MGRICFVPGCRSGYKQTKNNAHAAENTPSFFGAPKDPVLRKKWHIATRRADRELSEKDCVCELHFEEDCIERYFTTELFDGNTFKLERSAPILKKGSIPTIFPHSLPHSSQKSLKKKLIKQRAVRRNKSKKDQLVVNEIHYKRKEKAKDKNSSLAKNSQLFSLRKMPSCVAFGCTNRPGKKMPGLTFHRFPSNKNRRIAWICAVRRKDWQPSKTSILCSDHFTLDQFDRTSLVVVKLKPDAIPTIFSRGSGEGKHLVRVQTNVCDSSVLEEGESNSSINELVMQDKIVEEESPVAETISVVEGEKKGIYKRKTSTDENNVSSSGKLIKLIEGQEDIFGKFIASEMRGFLSNSSLYLRTKEKIWKVLADAHQRNTA